MLDYVHDFSCLLDASSRRPRATTALSSTARCPWSGLNTTQPSPATCFEATLFCVERVTFPAAVGSRSPGRVRTVDADALALTSDVNHSAP